ncbi:MAG: helix-turn-helix domain-containing protein [Bacteroidetes bacterium]|nr:helix-turn-helix domain-containing protein [Bacteroidota bacterium]
METTEHQKLNKEFAKIKQQLQMHERMIEQLYADNFDWKNPYKIAEILGVSKRSVDEYRRAGILPCSKLAGQYYFRLTEIHACLLKNLNVQTEKP